MAWNEHKFDRMLVLFEKNETQEKLEIKDFTAELRALFDDKGQL